MNKKSKIPYSKYEKKYNSLSYDSYDDYPFCNNSVDLPNNNYENYKNRQINNKYFNENHSILNKKNIKKCFKSNNNKYFNKILSLIFILFIIISLLFIFYGNNKYANASNANGNLISNNNPSNNDNPSNNNSADNNIANNTGSNKKIVIDAGHGGFDTGNKSSSGLKNEDYLNLIIAKKVGDELLKLGITPIYTRTGNDAIAKTKSEDMQKRVDIANTSNANAFVSIHLNSFSDTTVNGPEVYYYSDSSKRSDKSNLLAKSMQNSLNNATGGKRSSRSEDFMVIRETNIPAILIECGYMSNLLEESLLNSNEYQIKIAKAIAECIYNNFK